MDCDKLSPKAVNIFEKLKPFFPPDPWKKPQWIEGGRVFDNGEFDLRNSTDRDKLIDKTKMMLGSHIELAANIYHRNTKTLEGFEIEHFGKAIRHTAELLLILNELDFQIETMDLFEG